jgi:heme-degrading monooxygenase HmoA
MIAPHLEPPYYAVVFYTITEGNLEGYQEAEQRMEALAKLQKSYLKIESARNEIGITVSYWQTLADITNWENNIQHIAIRNLGRENLCKQYQLRICKVEHRYGFKSK